jgi:eukaryotic-like serine/threonine-protein kinase
MALTVGTRLGPYEVIAPLGAGGMGEVYRARDTSLDRPVALKILPDALAGDPDSLTRFEREARALASLNHPHIAQAFGFARFDGIAVIAMELVEGRTLAEAIGPSGIPVEDALSIARQIADALEAAHERGIVHRDLKPANIKLSPAGDAKVLDFGLAKANDALPDPASAFNSPTLTARATRLGTILGTAAYMAPEQARGKAVDRRADIWAFGAVLYEMLSGHRAFGGDDATEVLARILEGEPDFDRLPRNLPPALRQLLTRCLTKDPKARLRDIGEARITIERLIAGHDEPAVARAALAGRGLRPGRLVPWTVAVALGAAVVVLALRPARIVPAGPALSAAINLPADVEFFASPTLSADGSVAAFTGVREGIRRAYVRRLDSRHAASLTGSENSSVVTLSPDGSAVAVVTTDGRLIRLTTDGSVSQQLAQAVDFTASATWGADDRIVFGRESRLWSIPAAGGEPRAITTPDPSRPDAVHRAPVVSTDAAFLFYTSGGRSGGGNQLEAVALATGERAVVLTDGSQPIWASSDRLVVARDSALYIATLDRGRLVDSPARVFEGLAYTVTAGWAAAVSETGSLLVASGDVNRGRLLEVSLSGDETEMAGPIREYSNPRLSPDGRLVAFAGGDGLWTLELARGVETRVATSGASFPLWIDERRIVYRTLTGLVIGRADAARAEVALPETTSNDFPASISPDGRTLAIVRITPATSGDVYVVPVDGTGLPQPYVSTTAYEGGAQFSPDGQWVAYTSDETGRSEVYLASYPEPTLRFPVSSGGGLHPLWSRDGRRIFYRNGQRMMAVDVTLGAQPVLSAPGLLFERLYKFGPNLSIPHYALAREDGGFLMVKEEAGGRYLNLLTQWLPPAGAPRPDR